LLCRRKNFDNKQYLPEVQQWLAEYEQKVRSARDQRCHHGESAPDPDVRPTRVIAVQHLIGTTDKQQWPRPGNNGGGHHEVRTAPRELKPGDIVHLHSGHSDKYFQAVAARRSLYRDPLNGKSEGWPAPGPEAIHLPGGQGIRCVATDGPSLGGADPNRALMTYGHWASKGMVGVEYLTNVQQAAGESVFPVAAAKVRGGHGGRVGQSLYIKSYPTLTSNLPSFNP